jgi:ArsR family transcriptional regulator
MQNSTQQLITQLKALADPVRLRIVALCSATECSVTELTQVMSQSQPRISQHLKQICDSGILGRFRDGQFVYYRLLKRGHDASWRRQLLELLPDDEPAFANDIDRLRKLRGESISVAANKSGTAVDRALHHALVELTVAAPLGDLLDIGCGQGRILKLLASRARRVVGVDIDSDARRFARAEMLFAGIENSTLRKGNMHELPFPDAEFDTIILDDVLGSSKDPAAVLREARRLLRPGGRLLLLAKCGDANATELRQNFASWCKKVELRLATPRQIPDKKPQWLLAVITVAEPALAAA